MKTNEKLEAALHALEGDMQETLARWIRKPSVRAKAEPGAPFGRDVRACLDTAIEDIRRLGFPVRDIDGYCCDAEIGEGEETIAVLAHLDVVPAGDGWHFDPFGAEVENGRMYGRGTSDDKGPGVAALFAMKALLDAGVPLKRRVRLILGCDEECAMEDLHYYEEHVGLPDRGFSPDASFPLINTEKGITALTLEAPMTDSRLILVDSGTRSNVVPGMARAVIAGDVRAEAAEVFEPLGEECEIECSLNEGNTEIRITGVPAHGSMPDTGKNAAKMLLQVLYKLEIGGPAMAILWEKAGTENDGRGLGVAGQDDVSGKLTLNLGILKVEEGHASVTFDCRYPVFFHGTRVRETVERNLSGAGYMLLPGRDSVPHHVPESSELVKKLMDVYNGIMDTDAKPFAIGGGTYARHLKEGVAFGMLFPGEPELEHQADESIDLESFKKAARIYAYSIAALCE